MKRLLEEQRTDQARKRRRLVPKFVGAVIDGLGSNASRTLVEFVDANVHNIKTNSRGRQPIVHTPTSTARPIDMHPSGTRLAHVMTTGGLTPATCESPAMHKLLTRECRNEAARHYNWAIETMDKWFQTGDGDDPALRFFYTWDINTMNRAAPTPELADSTVRIVSINATWKRGVKRGTVVLDNGNVEHMAQCMREGTETDGVLCYAVVPPENQFMAHNIRHVCRAGRCMAEKIEKLILHAYYNNCPVRISTRVFDPKSVHYIEGFDKKLEDMYPNFMHNLVALPAYYHKKRLERARDRRGDDSAASKFNTSTNTRTASA